MANRLLTAEIADQVAAACRQAADELAAALHRALGAELRVQPAAPALLEHAALDEAWRQPGLILACTVAQQSIVAVLGESSGVLPDWVRVPDETGRSKLATLAQELGMLVLPDSIAAERFVARHVPQLHAALERAALESPGVRLPLQLSTADGRQGVLDLVWPAADAETWLTAETPQPSEPIEQPPSESTAAKAPQAMPAGVPRGPANKVDVLQLYARSLLHVQVPVSVTLASAKQPIGQILDLGPGSMIQFDKPCDELLELEVGGKSIGTGEVVKVGDKFGIRLNSLTVPGEKFHPVRPPK